MKAARNTLQAATPGKKADDLWQKSLRNPDASKNEAQR
jgi:hypothetical protein